MYAYLVFVSFLYFALVLLNVLLRGGGSQQSADSDASHLSSKVCAAFSGFWACVIGKHFEHIKKTFKQPYKL